MNQAVQVRSFELLARLLREDDREAVIHQLLATCLHGPPGFAALLPHLPADLLTPRAQMLAGARRASCGLGEAADALDWAALALRHADGRCASDCFCRVVRAEGVHRFLSRTVGRAATVLCASTDPYYQQLGELLVRQIVAVARPERDPVPSAPNVHPSTGASAA